MDEYIERDALLQDIEDSVRITSKTGMINPETRGAYKIIERIKSAAAADVVAVRHGCWERGIPSKSAAKWSTRVSCSNCHSAGYAHHKYCPNCGAKMDGGADNG